MVIVSIRIPPMRCAALMMRSAARLAVGVALLTAPAAFAQQQGGYANTYPPAVQQQYMSDCMRQTTQQALPVSPQVAQNYCGCLYQYLQARVPYQSYQRYDQMIRAGRGQQIDAQFRGVIQAGATQCIQRFVLGGGR
jgi:hypothetical protein